MKDYFNKNCDTVMSKKLWLFDMDGTIYLENDLFKGVKELLNYITENGGNYVFITNNSSKSVSDYVKKITGMGIKATEENFFTSAQAASMLILKRFGNSLIYAQGTNSFISGLKASGVNLTTEYNENVSAILVGFDTELTGEKMRTTSKMLTKVNVPYFATNPDWVCPVDFGYIPDCGSMCEGYFRATGRRPEFIGKPEPTMINVVSEKFGVDKKDVVVFGDRLYTDIASGVNAGVDTVFVLSGEATLTDLESSEVKPTYTLNGVWELMGV
jgi:HAD superfamily hydrolase (TIGR01450 family)